MASDEFAESIAKTLRLLERDVLVAHEGGSKLQFSAVEGNSDNRVALIHWQDKENTTKIVSVVSI